MSVVFISHRGRDQEAADRLARDLSQRGHNVWLDSWKINVGDSIVGEIEKGLSEATYLILCLSDADNGPWMNREWMSMLARQLAGASVKILPVTLTDCTPPAILADIKYCSLAQDWNGALEEICRALGSP